MTSTKRSESGLFWREGGYKMYHSISFGSYIWDISSWKNTWDDWHLVPKSRLLFVPPPVKTHYVDIPGANGILDLTDSLTGSPVYGNREGSFEFIVVNGYGDWAERYREILEYLHGKKHLAILEDEPSYYYEGRFTVEDWGSEESWSTITISYSVAPQARSVL